MYIYNLIFALLWYFAAVSSFLVAFSGKSKLYKNAYLSWKPGCFFHAFFSVYVNVFLFFRPEKVWKATKWPFPIHLKEKKKGKKKSDISDRRNSHHSKRKENHASSDIFKLLIFELL